MKKIILVTVISLGIFAIAGCGKTAEKPNTEAIQNKEPVKKVLKPGDLSPDKAVKLDELVESAVADMMAWTDKEVAVTGYVIGVSGSGGKDGFLMTLVNEKTSNKVRNSMSCNAPPNPSQPPLPEGGVLGKTVEVKGKIKKVEMEPDRYHVKLDPCELKKSE